MIDAADIESEHPNQPGQVFLRFSNSVINLQHVTEIENVIDGDKRSIVFRYLNGSERVFPYSSLADHSFAWQRLQHCLQNNLYSVEFTEACYRKWAGYRADEAESARRNAR